MSTMSDTALNMIDLEANGDARALLKLFEWRDVNVTVKDTKTKQPFKILDGITGGARPGM